MPDALQQALDNAAYNSPKDSPVHLENIESIIDPTKDEPILTGDPFVDFAKGQSFTLGEAHQKFFPKQGAEPVVLEQYNPMPPHQVITCQQQIQSDYHKQAMAKLQTYAPSDPSQTLLNNIADLSLDVKTLLNASDLTKLHLHALADMISAISTTINTAAQSMPKEPTLNHRSLEDWPDTTLLNELVNRENDLMPFYYELLKRIGSPELQSLVMSSMQGKNASMVTLAQLCSALAPTPIQPLPQLELSEQQKYAIQRDYQSTAMNEVSPQRKVTYPFNPYTS